MALPFREHVMVPKVLLVGSNSTAVQTSVLAGGGLLVGINEYMTDSNSNYRAIPATTDQHVNLHAHSKKKKRVQMG